jgi:hypothetical protein
MRAPAWLDLRAVIAAVIAAGIIAVVAWVSPVFLALLIAICHGLAAPFHALWHWLSTTIQVSRGQCVVWFLLGFGALAVILITRGGLQRRRRRRLEVETYEENPNGHAAAVLRYFAEHDGALYSIQSASVSTGLSVVRIKEILPRLERMKYIRGTMVGWELTSQGRNWVMSQGWA